MATGYLQPTQPFDDKNEDTPEIGGGLPVIEYWAKHTLSPEGPKLWKTLLHKSACLSCSWGTGGQKGGFTNETGEKLQRCMKKEIQQALEKLLGRSLSKVQGYDTQALIEAADADKVDTLICVGGNLYAANPDSIKVKRALGKIETIIYLATKLNLGHFHGLANQNTIIIPVLNRFENPHKTTVESGNNFVRLNDEGKTHLKDADLIAEVDFLTELANRIHGQYPVNWRKLQDTKYVRHLIAQIIPGYEKMATIDETKEEFTISGRIVTKAHFATLNRKVR